MLDGNQGDHEIWYYRMYLVYFAGRYWELDGIISSKYRIGFEWFVAWYLEYVGRNCSNLSIHLEFRGLVWLI